MLRAGDGHSILKRGLPSANSAMKALVTTGVDRERVSQERTAC